MKGNHRIFVSTKRIKYDFEIKRNITILSGNSATGKTTLVSMIDTYYNYGKSSGVQLTCDKECRVISGRDWKERLQSITDSIVFIDEGNEFVNTKEFAATIKQTDNYYVIVTRESLACLPYSIHEIYGIRESGKYGTLKATYNHLYPLYGQSGVFVEIKPALILTEDSNAGYQFFQRIAQKLGIKCISANGNSNIKKHIGDAHTYTENVLIIADGAAFGSEMQDVTARIAEYPNYVLYAPESFEWLILKSGLLSHIMVSAETLKEVLAHPEDFIDSSKYFSWERFFTDYLTQATHNIEGWQYRKTELANAYMTERATEIILRAMGNIDSL